MDRHQHFEAPPEPEDQLLTLNPEHLFAEDAAHEDLAARLERERTDITVDADPIEVGPIRRFRIDDPGCWNVIATAKPTHEAELRAVLTKFGEVHPSPFPNVVLVKVEDVDAFADALLRVIADDPSAARSVARLLPAQHTFRFDSLADLEVITRRVVDDCADDLEAATFHVRCHRRGRVNDIDTAEEEDFLGDAILRLLADRGSPGRVSFDDPDVVIDIETLNDEAAMSLWTREDMSTYPFLRID